MTDDGRVNLTIFSMESWRRWLVKEHNLQAIACLYLFPSNVLCNLYDWSKEFVLDRKQLRFSALRKASSSFNRARIYWLAMQDMYYPLAQPRIKLTAEDTKAMVALTRAEAVNKSKKMIAHGIRTVLFALQLFSTGQLSDLKCIAATWKELLLEQDDQEWSYFSQKYETRWKALAEQFPYDCAALADPELLSMPTFLHRLHYLVNLPSFQSSYQQGIERELFGLIRLERSSPNDTQDTSTSLISDSSCSSCSSSSCSSPSPTNMVHLLQAYFPKYEIVKDMYLDATRLFDSMVNLLQTDYNRMLDAVTANMKIKGTKFGQECAILAKPHTHYTLLFGLSKTSHGSALQHLISCPWTHFEILEEYVLQNPAPIVFPIAEATPSSTEQSASSSLSFAIV